MNDKNKSKENEKKWKNKISSNKSPFNKVKPVKEKKKKVATIKNYYL